MTLTQREEEELIQQYDKLIWSVVHRFKRRKNDGYQNKDDLHSECVIVFIKHIRACKTMEEVKKIPFRDMINAMCQYVLGEQALTYPKRTSNFRHVMESVPGKADLSEVDLDASCIHASLNDALDMVAFRDFFGTLSADDQKIIRMKLDGRRNRDIADSLGVSDVAMTRALKKLLRLYWLQAA